MSCILCDFVNKEKDCFQVWEDEHFLAFLDINPINPGHTLLIPKQHASDVFDLPEDLYLRLFNTARVLAPVMKRAFDAPRIGLAIEGFGVDHVHIHLVPVHNSNELNPERAEAASKEELLAIQEKFRDSLN